MELPVNFFNFIAHFALFCVRTFLRFCHHNHQHRKLPYAFRTSACCACAVEAQLCGWSHNPYTKQSRSKTCNNQTLHFKMFNVRLHNAQVLLLYTTQDACYNDYVSHVVSSSCDWDDPRSTFAWCVLLCEWKSINCKISINHLICQSVVICLRQIYVSIATTIAHMYMHCTRGNHMRISTEYSYGMVQWLHLDVNEVLACAQKRMLLNVGTVFIRSIIDIGHDRIAY